LPRCQRDNDQIVNPKQAAAATLAASAIAGLVLAAAAFAAPPPNDQFANAQVVTGNSASVTGSTVDATREPGEPGHGDYSVWYRWTPSASGTVTINTCDSNFDTVLSVYTGSRVDALTRIAQNEDSFACDSFGSRVRFDATAGTTYQIAVASNFDEQGDVVLDVELELPVIPPNDAFDLAMALGGYEDSARGTNVNATRQANEPAHAGNGGGSSVWFRWRAPGGGIAVIDTCRSNFNTLLGVYTGASVDQLKRIAADDNGCGGQSRVSFFAKRGTTYWLAVDGHGGDTGRVRIRVAQMKTGRYQGRTEFGDGKPISFKMTRNGRRIKRFTLSENLDCERGRILVGEFRLKRVWLEPMRVRKTSTGGAFSKRVRVRFRDGGHLTINVSGTLTPPDGARGRLKAKVTLPGNIRCTNFPFGDVSWRAHPS
jgi:hypothetical protein